MNTKSRGYIIGIALSFTAMTSIIACGGSSAEVDAPTAPVAQGPSDADFNALVERVDTLEAQLTTALETIDTLKSSIKVVTTRSTNTAGFAKAGATGQPLGCSFGGYDQTPQRLADSVECQSAEGTLFTALINGGTPGDKVYLYYPTLDCTGQAYVFTPDLGAIALRHGIVVRNQNDVFWVPPNSTGEVTTTNSVRDRSTGDCRPSNNNFSQVPAQINDPALSGVENSYAAIDTSALQ